jgi:L-lactate dehydrogenase complex protein LldG
MTSNRDDFFRELRAALSSGQVSGERSDPRISESDNDIFLRAHAVEDLIADQATDLLDRLANSAEVAGWFVYRAENAEEALGQVVDIVRSLGVTSVVRSCHQVLSCLELERPLRSKGVEVTTMAKDDRQNRPPNPADHETEVKSVTEVHSSAALREIAISAGLGLTGADYAIAETGSVVLAARQGVSRIVSLVPPVHIAVVKRGSVLPGLDELFTLMRRDYGNEDLASYVNIISGPSRSADIEYTLVTGVHGPAETHMILLNDGN